MTRRTQSIRGTSRIEDKRKAGCVEFILAFVPKGWIMGLNRPMGHRSDALPTSVEQGPCLGNYSQQSLFLEVSCSCYPCVSRTELVQSC